MTNIASSTLDLLPGFTVREIHLDAAGVAHQVTYQAKIGDDLVAAMNAHATDLGTNLEMAEVAANVLGVTTLGSTFSPTFAFSTVAENVAALRLAYASATQDQAVMIGDYLSGLTNAQLQSAFGLTAGQVTTLRTNKLTPAANVAASIRASIGQ